VTVSYVDYFGRSRFKAVIINVSPIEHFIRTGEPIVSVVKLTKQQFIMCKAAENKLKYEFFDRRDADRLLQTLGTIVVYGFMFLVWWFS
jgi:hypothetical protein